jgi:LmbE family N-acetylglucosaminyl deacetylase
MRWRYVIGLGALATVSVGGLLRKLLPPSRAVASAAIPGVKRPAAWPRPGSATTALTLPAHPRVILFSPHPDDETVGAGGLLYRLVHAGATVRVVFVTSGDGYPHAVQEDFGVKHPTDADYIAFGALRQREALAALEHLGVKRRAVRFLGFPDGGLAELWRMHWLPSHPYTSPYTKESSPPDADTVGYDGEDLTSVIRRVLRGFRPTVVVMPHPYDVHLDHAHASYFVTEALSDLQTSGVLSRRLVVLTYLVHYPSFPTPRGPALDRVLPPADLPDTAWTEAELTPAELDAKRAALDEYRSQLGVMNGFLRNFLCRNELFATVDSRILQRIASVH